MSRQLEQAWEEKGRRRREELVKTVEYGLKQAVEHSGAIFTGFAYKDRGTDHLIILKGVLAGRAQVAFVASEDLGQALCKAARLGRSDQLRWRADKYSTEVP